MPYIDQIITDALAGSPETHVAILAREVVRLREAPAVIPPLTDDEIEERYRSLTNGTDELEREWCYKDCRWAYSLAVYRARVAVAGSMLGTGMVAVDAEELRALERVRMEAEYVKDAFQQMGEFSQMEGVMRALHELDALRTHQEGVNHD